MSAGSPARDIVGGRRSASATARSLKNRPPLQLRKWLILTHRYAGIVLSLFFVMWFLSGIAMIYARGMPGLTDRKSTRLNSSHSQISYAVFCLKKKKHKKHTHI